MPDGGGEHLPFLRGQGVQAGGQIVQLVNTFILAQMVIQAQHITVE